MIKLTRFSSSVKQAIDYSKIIHENYIKRQLINISEEIKYDSVNVKDDKTSEIIIEEAEKSLFDLAERGNFSQTFIKFNLVLDQTIKWQPWQLRMKKVLWGFQLDLSDLDEKLGGLHKSDLVIIAGRPSMGKTALATNIAYFAAKKIKESQEKSFGSFFFS